MLGVHVLAWRNVLRLPLKSTIETSIFFLNCTPLTLDIFRTFFYSAIEFNGPFLWRAGCKKKKKNCRKNSLAWNVFNYKDGDRWRMGDSAWQWGRSRLHQSPAPLSAAPCNIHPEPLRHPFSRTGRIYPKGACRSSPLNLLHASTSVSVKPCCDYQNLIWRGGGFLANPRTHSKEQMCH